MRRFDEERRLRSLGECAEPGESKPFRRLAVEVLLPKAGLEERRSMLMELAQRRRGLGEGRELVGVEVTLRKAEGV